MKLYENGRLTAATAGEEDARAALARFKGARKGYFELVDGTRSLELRRVGLGIFFDVEEGDVLYGGLIPDHEAGGVLSAFLKGALPMPSGLAAGNPQSAMESFVMGGAAHPDCPLCRAMGLES